MMTKLTFTTTPAWDMADGFGCASLGLAGVCDNNTRYVSTFSEDLEGIVLSGNYDVVMQQIQQVQKPVLAAIVLFGNAGGENAFMQNMQQFIKCPIVGGGAAIDGASGRAALLTGNAQVAVFLITDERFTYHAVTRCIHDNILGQVKLTLADPRTILTIDGENAADFLQKKRQILGLSETDFEHLTISDHRNVNAQLSCVDGVIKSGRDVQETMLLRYVVHEKVYDTMRAFYDDENAIIFGCAGLSGLLDRPLDTHSLGLYLFGEVCTVDGVAEFGNLMLSKLVLNKR
jgi:hypothetical protein